MSMDWRDSKHVQDAFKQLERALGSFDVYLVKVEVSMPPGPPIHLGTMFGIEMLGKERGEDGPTKA